MVGAHFVNKDDITSTQPKAMLDDAIDAVAIRQLSAASTQQQSHNAFMAPEKLFNGDQHMGDLPFVDIFQHEGIWACLDEGCNSNCHGTGWRENVVSKLQMRRLSPYMPGNAEWVSRQQRVYSGIGNSQVIH